MGVATAIKKECTFLCKPFTIEKGVVSSNWISPSEIALSSKTLKI
jgi:hypothetical protein